MYSILILTVISCALSLILTPMMRNWSVRLGLVDRPDQKRKTHLMATPRTGGIPLVLSYVGAYAFLLVLPLKGSGYIDQHLDMVWRLLPPIAIVFLTGLADDWLSLRPWQKVVGQVAAAVWAYVAGVRILGVAGNTPAPWLSFLLTVGWLILCSNAFNLIDGVDGLAAGVGLTTTLTTFIAGMIQGDLSLGLVTAPLAGALLGFLRYNFNPASIFLGDSGSLLIGFLLGCYGAIWSQKSATMLGLAAPAMALALPLLEVGLSILRRFLRNEPIFSGDRGHIHHRLLDRGFTPRRVALLLYGVGGIGALLSLMQSVIWNRMGAVVIVLFGAVTWVGIHYLGYAEFTATGRFLMGNLRPLLGAHVQLELLERSLRAATTVEECWEALESAARALGYSHMTARLHGLRFATTAVRPQNGAHWQMRLNLDAHCYVNITQQQGAAEQPILLIPFTDVVRRVLPEKLLSLTGPDGTLHSLPRNSRTTTVMSSDCVAPSVNAVTAS